MQNIESITLENWPVSSEQRDEKAPICHFALRQKGVNLDFHLKQYFHDRRLSFHYFENFEDLNRLCHRFPINAIVMGSRYDLTKELELVGAIKHNILLSIVPVILYHPEPDRSTMITAYESGVEEFIYGEWIDRLVQVRIARVIERSQRDVSVNPSTSLPGPSLIEQEINRQIQMGEKFAVCYVDLDNFKAFNDYNGYVYGDKMIRMTRRILRDVVFDLCPEGFVGHIAGDDFIAVIPAEVVDQACQWIIKCFDAFVPYKYDPEDRSRGYFVTKNRKGEMEQYPLLSISIAVVVNHNGEFRHIGELSKMLADLKKATKARAGSNYMIERRQKY